MPDIGAYPSLSGHSGLDGVEIGAYQIDLEASNQQIIGAYQDALGPTLSIGAYNHYVVNAEAGGGVFPRGLSKIFFGVNPHRVASLGGELQE